MIILLLAIGIFVLALFGAPLFVVISAGALLSFHLAEIDLSAVIIEMYRLTSAPTLMAIPLYTFAGFLLAESGSPNRIVKLAKAIFGWIPGGLGIAALFAAAMFTAFTGASGVTIIALGGLLFPILIKEGYPEKFSLGLLTTSGSLGLLFPPSLPIILYGLVSRTSVDRLFLAGVLPCLLLITMLSVYSIRKGVTSKIPRTKFSFKEVKESAKFAIWEIPLPFIILGGIYGGIFTATEAAGITAFYVFMIEVFVYRDLSISKDIPRIMQTSMTLVGAILIILGTAMGFTSYLIDEQVPMKILAFMKIYITSKLLFLILLNIFLLIVGCMMDIFSAIIVVVPLITPIAMEFGVDPVHLGIIFLTNLEIGYSTPPVGINLFISSSRFNKPIFTVYRASLPFLGILALGLMIITYFPQLSLFLVDLVFE
ncbi:MAG: TRAP transporter large permease [Candidatus Anammoxibacter sp.]